MRSASAQSILILLRTPRFQVLSAVLQRFIPSNHLSPYPAHAARVVAIFLSIRLIPHVVGTCSSPRSTQCLLPSSTAPRKLASNKSQTLVNKRRHHGSTRHEIATTWYMYVLLCRAFSNSSNIASATAGVGFVEMSFLPDIEPRSNRR